MESEPLYKTLKNFGTKTALNQWINHCHNLNENESVGLLIEYIFDVITQNRMQLPIDSQLDNFVETIQNYCTAQLKENVENEFEQESTKLVQCIFKQSLCHDLLSNESYEIILDFLSKIDDFVPFISILFGLCLHYELAKKMVKLNESQTESTINLMLNVTNLLIKNVHRLRCKEHFDIIVNSLKQSLKYDHIYNYTETLNLLKKCLKIDSSISMRIIFECILHHLINANADIVTKLLKFCLEMTVQNALMALITSNTRNNITIALDISVAIVKNNLNDWANRLNIDLIAFKMFHPIQSIRKFAGEFFYECASRKTINPVIVEAIEYFLRYQNNINSLDLLIDALDDHINFKELNEMFTLSFQMKHNKNVCILLIEIICKVIDGSKFEEINDLSKETLRHSTLNGLTSGLSDHFSINFSDQYCHLLKIFKSLDIKYFWQTGHSNCTLIINSLLNEIEHHTDFILINNIYQALRKIESYEQNDGKYITKIFSKSTDTLKSLLDQQMFNDNRLEIFTCIHFVIAENFQFERYEIDVQFHPLFRLIEKLLYEFTDQITAKIRGYCIRIYAECLVNIQVIKVANPLIMQNEILAKMRRFTNILKIILETVNECSLLHYSTFKSFCICLLALDSSYNENDNKEITAKLSDSLNAALKLNTNIDIFLRSKMMEAITSLYTHCDTMDVNTDFSANVPHFMANFVDFEPFFIAMLNYKQSDEKQKHKLFITTIVLGINECSDNNRNNYEDFNKKLLAFLSKQFDTSDELQLFLAKIIVFAMKSMRNIEDNERLKEYSKILSPFLNGISMKEYQGYIYSTLKRALSEEEFKRCVCPLFSYLSRSVSGQ